MYPKKKVSCTWSPKFAYALGLLATDGCLSKDGRHIDFTSKDLELVKFFKNYLSLSNKITKKTRSIEKEKKYFHIQFGDINFYKFLIDIGITPAKSRTISSLKIPRNYFPDFLRGCIDGDGNIRTFDHPESQYPQLRTRLFSASENFLKWINSETSFCGIKGVINWGARVYVLEYAMGSSIKLFKKIYYKNYPKSLKRKFLIAKPFLRT
jgi:hypothetical protein